MWADRRLAKACATDRDGSRRFGIDQWKVLKRRLEVLEVAESMVDVPATPGRFHALSGPRLGQYALDLRGPYRLVVEPATDPLPLLPNGELDLTRVRAVRVLEVADYHE